MKPLKKYPIHLLATRLMRREEAPTANRGNMFNSATDGTGTFNCGSSDTTLYVGMSKTKKPNTAPTTKSRVSLFRGAP